MGTRGPAPAPTSLKLLRGEKKRSRINEDEPQPMIGQMDPPSDLHPEVAEVWRRLVIEIEHMGIAYPSDIEQWRMYCETVIVQRRLSALALKSPPLIKGSVGNMVKNPIYSQLNEATHAALRLAREFGLTPSARSMIEVNRTKGKDDDNPFANTG